MELDTLELILDSLPLFLGVIVLGLGYIIGNRFVNEIAEGVTSFWDWLGVTFKLLWLSTIGFVPIFAGYYLGGWRLLGLYLLAFSIGLLVGVTLMPAVRRFEVRHPNIAAIISGAWVTLWGALYLVGGVRSRNSEYLWIGLTTTLSGLLTLTTGLLGLWRR